DEYCNWCSDNGENSGSVFQWRT
ncbi:hypothetical protein A2U01_0062558, partial [Trifolium medium]|nr:hypothetical protein [Trifolium medium]